jgi:hypothetical protein
MQVRLSYQPKFVRFTYVADTAQVKTEYVHNGKVIDSKYLTADEQNELSEAYEFADYERMEVQLSELINEYEDGGFLFDTVDGDDCNFVQMLYILKAL